ncbi:MAG: T9SS type A sorting domain-containing protein [Chitinophagales bacterium]
MKNTYFKILFFFLFIHFNLQAQPPQCEKGVNFADLDINNVKARYWASGNMWFDSNLAQAHYEVPKGSGKHSFLSFDFWLGAVDEMGRERIVFQTYGGVGDTQPRYFPGPLDDIGDTYVEVCEHYDRVWKINKSTVDSFRKGLLTNIPKDILEWPAKNNPHIAYSPERELAPFVDVNGDSNYNPTEGDFPEILGDQALWWVFNDKGGYGSPFLDKTLGMEIQAMAYAYNSVPELQNHTFYKYTFTNRSPLRMDSMMIGMYADVDLGQFDDDYTGCETLRNMGIAYNGDDFDGIYKENIPIVGLKLLQGPQKSNGTYSDMYTCWNRNGDPNIWGFPEHETHAYRGLWGLLKDGSSMTYDNTPFLHMHPSDPTDENGLSMCSLDYHPADVRMFMGIGPFTMQVNEQKELHFAALWVEEGVEYPCPSFAPIQEAADYVQNLFDNGLITNIEDNSALISSNSSLQIFPNPTTTNTVLTLEQNPNQAFQEGTLQLFDSLGQLVKSMTLKGKQHNELTLSGLQSGVYFYRLQWEKGRVENGKLMIQ